MKKIIFSIAMMIAGLSQAQVIISNQANPTPTNSSVLLEFGNNENKGIILPQVSDVTDPVNGTFAVNTTTKSVQMYENGAWKDLTVPEYLVEHSFVNDGTSDVGEGVVIGAASSARPGALVLESTTQALVLPKVANPHLTIFSPIAGTLVYDTVSDALAVYDGAGWSFWAANIDASGILNGVTLVQNRWHWIASVFDTDYLPYTAPIAPASIAVVNADGTPDAVTVDVQGSITTTGITVRIPVASVVGSGNIGAWTSTFVVPAEYAEDGISRTLELSWEAQAYTASSQYITATIKSLGGTFNAKKLDINAGIGNDYLGLLLGAFQYPYNDAGNLTSYQVRDIPGIPDRMFGETDANGNKYNYLFLPVQAEDGNIWLNNNLGANYANLDHAQFNLVQQATSLGDLNATGFVYQQGRGTDGHQIWTSSVILGPVTYADSNPANSWYGKFIRGSNPFFYPWINPYINNLWEGESSPNNPCPRGFRVPTPAEWAVELGTISPENNAGAYNSLLKLSATGLRHMANGEGTSGGGMNPGITGGYYWTSSVGNSIHFTNAYLLPYNRNPSYGLGVRCIQD